MKISEFKPQFQTGIVETGPLGTYLINPLYALNPDSANQLAGIILATFGIPVKIAQGPPFGTMNGPWQSTTQVPWVQFPSNDDTTDGPKENAGSIAALFTHGYPPSFIEYLLSKEIQNLYLGQ